MIQVIIIDNIQFDAHYIMQNIYIEAFTLTCFKPCVNFGFFSNGLMCP